MRRSLRTRLSEQPPRGELAHAENLVQPGVACRSWLAEHVVPNELDEVVKALGEHEPEPLVSDRLHALDAQRRRAVGRAAAAVDDLLGRHELAAPPLEVDARRA